MKIVGIVASPNNNGNTAFTINKIIEGAKEQGAETETFYFNNLNIKPCQGCLACKKGDKRCIINDDMQKIYSAIENADAIILGSPVYMGQMSAQAKIFTDRMFSEISPRFSPHFKEKSTKKKLLLVFTQGNPDLNFFKPYYDYTKKMFELLEFDVKDIFVVSGTRTEQAKEKEDLHAIMKNAGSSLAS